MAQSTGTDQGNKFAEKPRLERLLLLMTGSASGEYDAERGQAIIRVAITCFLLIYLLIMLAVAEDQDSQQFSKLTSSFFTYFFIYFCSSLLLIYWIVRKPGNYTYRRILTMTMDYGSLTLWMMLGGMVTLPLWAIVLWVTVGNGLRFGHRYLVAATCYALASLLIVWFFEDYWGANPYVVVAMALTTILVPAYVYGLLTRLQMAHEATIEANQAKSRFLAHASHDLRQPIHAISLYVACLRDENLSGESRAMVENIDRSLQSVSRLFRSLLDISTLDSGGVKPEFRTIAVNDLLADVINQNKSAIEWSDISLRIIPCSAHVKADGVLLTSMVQNLISNAVKYAPGADILIGCRRRNGRLSIEVHDQGPGIPEEHLPHIFEELYRVRKTGDRDIDGVGLGLSIVRRMGALMGLSVTVHSILERGTVASINDLIMLPPAPRQPVLNKPNLTNGLRVLLVEDDEGVLRATTSLLEKWGCIVQAETAPPDRVHACDVLLTDFDLGGNQTGANCIDLVRKMTRSNIPAIVITGHHEAKVQQELADKSIAVLGKPIRPAEMRSMLTAIMLRSRNNTTVTDQTQP